MALGVQAVIKGIAELRCIVILGELNRQISFKRKLFCERLLGLFTKYILGGLETSICLKQLFWGKSLVHSSLTLGVPSFSCFKRDIILKNDIANLL